ncbi:MAG: Helix-turn-helix domain protein [Candidatus Midichloriaceae bacterium]|jgi:hypothetical protein|nr:Helix-turn-helix domain protein [Candidatus Midichloriaceae bacterium]
MINDNQKHLDHTSNKHLLSRREAAEFLGIKDGTLSVWACTKRYELPYVKVGRLVKYRLPDLLTFIKNRTQNEIGE